MINEIFDFNRSRLGVETKTVPYLEYRHAAFCVKAIREEAQELHDQHHIVEDESGSMPNEVSVVHTPNDEKARLQTVHSVDALLDAAYFAIGGLARAGLTEEQAIECFLAVHQANMTKKKGIKENRGDMGVADAIKPDDFVPPEAAIYRILFASCESN